MAFVEALSLIKGERFAVASVTFFPSVPVPTEYALLDLSASANVIVYSSRKLDYDSFGGNLLVSFA